MSKSKKKRLSTFPQKKKKELHREVSILSLLPLVLGRRQQLQANLTQHALD